MSGEENESTTSSPVEKVGTAPATVSSPSPLSSFSLSRVDGGSPRLDSESPTGRKSPKNRELTPRSPVGRARLSGSKKGAIRPRSSSGGSGNITPPGRMSPSRGKPAKKESSVKLTRTKAKEAEDAVPRNHTNNDDDKGDRDRDADTDAALCPSLSSPVNKSPMNARRRSLDGTSLANGAREGVEVDELTTSQRRAAPTVSFGNLPPPLPSGRPASSDGVDKSDTEEQANTTKARGLTSPPRLDSPCPDEKSPGPQRTSTAPKKKSSNFFKKKRKDSTAVIGDGEDGHDHHHKHGRRSGSHKEERKKEKKEKKGDGSDFVLSAPIHSNSSMGSISNVGGGGDAGGGGAVGPNTSMNVVKTIPGKVGKGATIKHFELGMSIQGLDKMLNSIPSMKSPLASTTSADVDVEDDGDDEDATGSRSHRRASSGRSSPAIDGNDELSESPPLSPSSGKRGENLFSRRILRTSDPAMLSSTDPTSASSSSQHSLSGLAVTACAPDDVEGEIGVGVQANKANKSPISKVGLGKTAPALTAALSFTMSPRSQSESGVPSSADMPLLKPPDDHVEKSVFPIGISARGNMSVRQLEKMMGVPNLTPDYEWFGATYLMGVYFSSHANTITRYLEKLKAKKKTKSLLQQLRSQQKKLPDSLEDPLLVQNLPRRGTRIVCSDNSVAVLDGDELYMSGVTNLHPSVFGKKNVVELGFLKFNHVRIGLVADVAMGPFHTVAVTKDNKVLVWGSNVVMHALDLSKDTVIPPSPPPSTESDSAVPSTPALTNNSSSGNIGSAIGGSGGAKGSGFGKKAKKRDIQRLEMTVSAPTTGPAPAPTPVDTSADLSSGLAGRAHSVPKSLLGHKGKVLELACGGAHTCVLTDQALYTCGLMVTGALGRTEGDQHVLCPVTLPCRIAKVSCGVSHTVAIAETGEVLAWGSNYMGQLGLGKEVQMAHMPQTIATICDIKQVACGATHTVAVNVNGRVFVWGWNDVGELGLGKRQEKYYDPTPLEALEDVRVASIDCGTNSSVAVTDSGNVYIWGKLMAANFSSHQYTPRLLEALHEKQLFAVQAGLGVTHVAVIADTKLTDVLQAMCIACSTAPTNKPTDPSQLKQLLRSIPVNYIRKVQTRAHQHLRESDSQVPPTSIDKYFIEVRAKKEQKKSTKVFRISNKHEKLRVKCTLFIANTERYQSSRYLIEFEPQGEIVIDKRQDAIVKLHITYQRPPTEEIDVLFSVRADFEHADKKSKAGKAMSLGSGLKSKRGSTMVGTGATGVYHYVICHISPVDVAKTKVRRTAKQVKQLVGTMATYVPRYIRKDLALNCRIPTQPLLCSFTANILFIDVSGFTALNERLAKLGPAGPEQVSKHLNSYFGQLIEVVEAHGGDVLKFAGDALICMFGDDEQKEAADCLARRALQCGFEIQTNLAEYDSNEGFKLTLHIGVGSGKICSLYVGGVDSSWEFLVVGEPFLQLKTAVDNSKAGEVVVSKECWQLIKPYCVGEDRGNDIYVTEIKEELVQEPLTQVKIETNFEDPLRSYIQAGVQAKLDAQQSAWLAELRRVTVLFVKLSSLAYDENTFEIEPVHQVLRYMQSVVFKYEGMVRQFLVDDKGTVLIAAFGVPPFSHEDDCVRGLKAALEIHEGLEEKGMHNSVGVTTGNVFCGSVGSSQRQEYAMVGDIVNLSARLMVSAGKLGVGVLTEETTYQAAAFQLDFEKLDAIMVKGKSQPIEIYKPSFGARSKAGMVAEVAEDNVFEEEQENQYKLVEVVGRKKECDEIKTNLNKLTKSKKGAVTIFAGAPGIGKTHLLNHIRDLCQDVSGGFFRYFVQVIEGAGDSVEKQTPFFMWKRVLVQLLYLDQFTDVKSRHNFANIMKTLNKDCDEYWLQYAPLLNTILPLGIEENDITRGMPDKQRNVHTRELMKHLLQQRANKRPLVLILDDFHWVDSASLQLAYEVAKEISPLYFVMGTRAMRQPVAQEWKLICSLPEAHTFPLKEMLPDEVMWIVCKRLSIFSMPKELEKIVQKAEGNPLFAEQIAISLVESGAVDVTNGSVHVHGDLRGVELPNSIQGLLSSRIDRLPPSPQMVLKVASVIGREFTKDCLRNVFPIEEERDHLKLYLRLLLADDLIIRKVKGTYIFKNEIIHTVANGRLLFLQRQQLHRAIADYLEKKHADDLEPVYPLLAIHWSEALLQSQRASSVAELEKAIQYIVRISVQASASQATQEADDWKCKATQLAEKVKTDKEREMLLKEVDKAFQHLSKPSK